MKTEDIKNLKIGVIGGGYAGATAGLTLAHIGANVKVYEQAPASGEVGAGIGLRPATVKLFKKLGIFPAIEKVTSPSDYFEILDAKGNRINLEEWPFLSEGDEKHNTRMIHRRDFIDALTGQLPEGVLQYGYRAEEITDNGDSATVKFANGEEETFDILVGADGATPSRPVPRSRSPAAAPMSPWTTWAWTTTPGTSPTASAPTWCSS